MLSRLIIVALCLVSAAHAITVVSDNLPWANLHVTWGKFSSLPYTESDAISGGWTLTPCNAPVSDPCTGDVWVGRRYVYQGDVATMLLFNADGQFAGIQGGLLNAPYPANANYFDAQPNCPGLPNHWIITMYTRDPNSICVSSGGGGNVIGDRAFLKTANGPIEIPLLQTEAQADPTQPWIDGKCFWTMGKHYWWDISNSMDCNDFFPMFLLYNKGTLTGFGWTYGGQETSSRWEHPHGSAIKMFFNPETMPACLPNEPSLSTQHIYFTQPLLAFC